MSVYINKDKISKVYFGGDNIVKIYKGRDLVFGDDGGGGDEGYWIRAKLPSDVATYNSIFYGIHKSGSFMLNFYPTSALTAGTHRFNDTNTSTVTALSDAIGLSLIDDKVSTTKPSLSPITELKVLPSYTKQFNTIYSFNGNTTIQSIDMSDITLEGLTSMDYFFRDCTNLTSVNLSNFSAPNIKSMFSMFGLNYKLTSINLEGINVPNVRDITHICSFIEIIEELDLSPLQVEVYHVSYLVYYCTKLKSLNVSSITLIKNVYGSTDMTSPFEKCPVLSNIIFGEGWGKSPAKGLTLDLSTCNADNNYQFTDETWNSLLTLYDRATNGLPTMTIKIKSSSNFPSGWVSKMTAKGYTISYG